MDLLRKVAQYNKKIVLILKELEKRIKFPDFFQTFIKFLNFPLISNTEIFPDNPKISLISLIAGHHVFKIEQ